MRSLLALMLRNASRPTDRVTVWPQEPACPPLEHRFRRVVGTYRGAQVAQAVLCVRCRRTAAQLVREQPALAAAFTEHVLREKEEADGAAAEPG